MYSINRDVFFDTEISTKYEGSFVSIDCCFDWALKYAPFCLKIIYVYLLIVIKLLKQHIIGATICIEGLKRKTQIKRSITVANNFIPILHDTIVVSFIRIWQHNKTKSKPV